MPAREQKENADKEMQENADKEMQVSSCTSSFALAAGTTRERHCPHKHRCARGAQPLLRVEHLLAGAVLRWGC